MIWNIIWYFLLPFVVIYKTLRKWTEDMSDTEASIFYFLLLIVILQIIEVITNL